MSKPFDPYNVNFNGFKLDPYRVNDIFQITFPPVQQIVKKALRCGQKHKSTVEDLREVITSAQRGIEMIEEQERWKNQPELPFAEVQPIGAELNPPRERCPQCGNLTDTHGLCSCDK